MNYKLNDLQKDLLFGTLLGDGNLSTGNNGRTWRYRAIHSDKQKYYLFHKFEILEPLCNTPPAASEDDRKNVRYSFNTRVDSCFNYYGNMFYQAIPDIESGKVSFKKVMPKNSHLNDNLSPRALAYLHMDDGSLKWFGHSNAMRISLEAFCREDLERFKNVLMTKYNIKVGIERKNRSSDLFRIFISEKSSAAYRDLIKDFLVDSLKYKVSDGHRMSLGPRPKKEKEPSDKSIDE